MTTKAGRRRIVPLDCHKRQRTLDEGLRTGGFQDATSG
jgi:hypothetical protein